MEDKIPVLSRLVYNESVKFISEQLTADKKKDKNACKNVHYS